MLCIIILIQITQILDYYVTPNVNDRAYCYRVTSNNPQEKQEFMRACYMLGEHLELCVNFEDVRGTILNSDISF